MMEVLQRIFISVLNGSAISGNHYGSVKKKLEGYPHQKTEMMEWKVLEKYVVHYRVVFPFFKIYFLVW